ncbi:MAG TPA: hypothetical protein G4O07_01320 [Dehalococcoidia bacterium]|nr:hypothetical protein [Dehalococcoidia bacterium]
MEWPVVVVLVVILPVVLFPAAFVWYLNVGGVYAAVKEAIKRRAVAKQKTRGVKIIETESTTKT